ncbi:MAG TPA: response regulator transcription factor [Brevundimonas sp.]|uniref:response regulator transcription factor n=1 Tax=Brevundimonas sp. TaxID=1871086 RepID=UPI002E166B8A|nr:response regulator transcription factor [Brevundimonas sp.]
MPHAVAIVEDDPFVRRHLARLIEAHAELKLVGQAGALAQGRELLAADPDLVVIDLGLPDGSGLDLIREAAARTPPPRLLVLTVFGDESSVLSAVAAGADGYVLKDSADEALCADMIETLNGGSPISASVAAYLLRRLRRDEDEAPPAEAPEAQASPVTPREVELLNLLARGLSYREVAGALNISHHTVGAHIKAIYRKLAVNSRSEAVFEAVQSGLIRL